MTTQLKDYLLWVYYYTLEFTIHTFQFLMFLWIYATLLLKKKKKIPTGTYQTDLLTCYRKTFNMFGRACLLNENTKEKVFQVLHSDGLDWCVCYYKRWLLAFKARQKDPCQEMWHTQQQIHSAFLSHTYCTSHDSSRCQAKAQFKPKK